MQQLPREIIGSKFFHPPMNIARISPRLKNSIMQRPAFEVLQSSRYFSQAGQLAM